MPSPQSSVASDVKVLATRLATANTKRKNLALSLLTGLRKKRTNFLKRGPPNSVSCGEFHKEKNKNLERYLFFVQRKVSRKPENATAGEETAAESRVRVQAVQSSDLARLEKMEFRKLKKVSPISTS